MTFEETRDNTTAIEANQQEADDREEVREGIRRSKPFMDDYLPEQEEPEDDEPEDDGQPSECEEWPIVGGGHFEDGMW